MASLVSDPYAWLAMVPVDHERNEQEVRGRSAHKPWIKKHTNRMV